MVFSSPVFLSIFLPVLLGIYFLSQKRLRNYVLLTASLFFYSWGEPKAVFVMLLLIVINYFIGLGQAKYLQNFKGRAKILLALSILINLGALFCYKYLSFFIDISNHFLALFKISPLNDPKIALPIGISFYVFQIISYQVDLYRGAIKVQRRFSSLALYISLFPQLVAGPIVRYATIAKDIENRDGKFNNLFRGLHRFVFGLAKKVLIADNMALIADTVFGLPAGEVPFAAAWVGALAYTLQIYFDFSGYSDMAIGLGRIFNFRFLENFNYPYSAVSVQDFWRRWHISLSTWFRDYLYIPLGGNRKGSLRTYVNLMLVFLLCGLWHGAAWNFVVWGLYQGAALTWERAGLRKYIEKLPKILGNIYVMLFVIVGWVIFRADSLPYALKYIKIMFFGNPNFPLPTFHQATAFINFSNLWILIFGFFVSYPYLSKKFSKIKYKTAGLILTAALFFITYLFALASNYSPFIYFRF